MWPPVGPLTSEQLANIKASGITAINLTVTVGRADFETVVAGLAFWNSQVEANPERLCVIRRHTEIDAAKRAGKLGMIFGFQRTAMLGEDLGRIKLISMWYKTGLRTQNPCTNAACGFRRRVSRPIIRAF
jgi:membrane dipeptidase